MNENEKIEEVEESLPFYERHPRISNILFWLTAWRPITRYEHEKLVKVLIQYIDENNREILNIKIKMNQIIKQLNRTGKKIESDEDDDVMFN